MSAVLAARYDDRVELAVDGGSWISDGTLVRVFRKCWAVPGTPMVVTGVGGSDEIESLARLVMCGAMNAEVDQAILWLERILPERPEVSAPIPFELIIAAISEAHGAQIWRWRNLRLGDTALPALKVCYGANVALGPELSPEEMLAAGYDYRDFRSSAIGLMDAMRAKKCRPKFLEGRDFAEGCYVGGHVDHAVVSPAGVTVERVREWPDVVGQVIRPTTCPPKSSARVSVQQTGTRREISPRQSFAGAAQ